MPAHRAVNARRNATEHVGARSDSGSWRCDSDDRGRRLPSEPLAASLQIVLIMLTLLIVLLLIALLGGGLGYGRFGAAGLGPAGLIILILVILAVSGRL
jgi:hypothetical protein